MAVLIALDYVRIAISLSGRLFCYHDTSCSILHAGCYRCIADKPYVILLYYWFYSLKNWTSALDAVSCCITRRLISCRCCADECRYITMQTKPFMPVRHRQFSYINIKGRSKNYEFKYSLILLFLFRSLFVSFDVILSSFISHIARYAPSSTYKSTYERRTKINSTYFLERPLNECSKILPSH